MALKLLLIAACVLLSACSESNNLILGTVSANLDRHHVIVTDCYRATVPPARKVYASGRTEWQFTPCRDAAIEIAGDKLTVNGRPYGRIEPDDGILVDHGEVSVQHDGLPRQARN